jgi:hypothetical protein
MPRLASDLNLARLGQKGVVADEYSDADRDFDQGS